MRLCGKGTLIFLSVEAVVTSIPKKRFSVCGGVRVSFRLAVKLTVKTHMDSVLKPHWKLGAIKCKLEFKNQFGLAGPHPCSTNPKATSGK